MVFDKTYQILKKAWTVSSQGSLRIKIMRVSKALPFLWAALWQRAEETAARWIELSL